MCGIAGIFSTTLDPSQMRSSAERMQCALVHRGPDDAGFWQSNGGHAALAHRRLSIIDLSSAAKQPMSTTDGRFTICFNGEIYNFRELRTELEREGITFATHSDTEVILRMYEHEGSACVKRLRGMFAFALWDEGTRTAFLARDPFGIKPLYYHHTSTTLAFASELRALVKSEAFIPTLSSLAVTRYFESGTVPEPLTLVNEARTLESGQTLEWHEGKTTAHTYWSIDFENAAVVRGGPVTTTRAALEDSVRHHFVSDVPVGVFLSGGLDSTAVLALAKATGQTDVGAFCIAVDDEQADESSIAKRSAAHFGARYHEMRLNAEVAQELFRDFLQHLDQPSIDGLNTFTVSALARRHGIKVVLSGLGGDELFGGYASFHRIPQMLRMHRLARAVPGIETLGSLMLRKRQQHRRWSEFLQSPGTVSDAYQGLRGIFTRKEAAQLSAWVAGLSDVDHPASSMEHPASNVHDEISRLELTRYMRNQLLRDSDVMSMARGLELRVPFVDRSLFEAVAGIPASVRLQRGKRLLVDAVPELPEWVTKHKKRGFLFPYQKWLAAGWREAFDEACHGSPVPVTQWYQMWSVFVLRHCLQSLQLQHT